MSRSVEGSVGKKILLCLEFAILLRAYFQPACVPVVVQPHVQCLCRPSSNDQAKGMREVSEQCNYKQMLTHSDEIHYQPPKPSVYDILGGAGTYSALGARLFSPPPSSKTIGWIIDRGSDFPDSLDTEIRGWSTSALIRTDLNRLTTRGWNSLDASETRAFRYKTPKLRLDADSIASSEPLLRSKSYHLICSPDRCITLVKTILGARKALSPIPPRPIFIWEPVPDLMLPSELLNLTRALPFIDILSPNAVELGQLLGYSSWEVESPTGEVNPDFVESATVQLLESMPLSSYAIVVRCGKSGLYIGKNGGRSTRVSFFEPEGAAEAREVRRAERERRKAEGRRIRLTRGGKTLASNTYAAPTPAPGGKGGRDLHGGLTADTDMMALFAHLETKPDPEDTDSGSDTETEPDREVDDDPDYGINLWYPAYFTAAEGSRVVDPTGGGNAFLGGLAIGLARGVGLEAACRWGSVAASFAIEQVGMPVLTSAVGNDGMNTGQAELWNGESVMKRLDDYDFRAGVGLEAMSLD